MRDDEERASGKRGEHHLEDLVAAVRVQRSRRLVGQHQRRSCDHGPGDRDPLAFAPGQFAGPMSESMLQLHLGQCLPGALEGFGRCDPPQAEYESDVLLGGELVEQSEVLVDVPDHVEAQVGACSH